MTNNNSTTTVFDFSTLQALISSEGVQLHASEVHGVLTGLICGGFTFEGSYGNTDDKPADHKSATDNSSYLALITDLLNNGDSLPNSLNEAFQRLYNELWQAILNDDFSFTPLIADDDDTLAERSQGLCNWVQGFTLGFGLQQKNTNELSADVQDVLSDFVEIANLSDDIDEDEDSEQAFFEISEYVRISALLCFAEHGVSPEQTTAKTILH
ncbi:MAG: hypothetical protein COB35_10220 [Gammaproteobacteria bacterium]|nr:MAG: hypothetical protein COB35_10220 [Gammaproteobacteria bacterium]